ncbi:rhomboid-like protein [Mycobacterium sp. OTB74]|uniref:rhomboid-like protein n=1 Tax=Mycobacterium sp. OTB74 TaxID=1853452 RepID=UPI0024746DBD|nr:rhomboid-like protein [Mycobacterium sp. OTB74]
MTISYAIVLLACELTLTGLGPGVDDAVVNGLSTNVYNIGRGHVSALIGSMFVTSTGYIYVWLPGLVCLLAVAELFWRSRRLIVTFWLGHLGATLVVVAGLALAIGCGWLPAAVARATDVGISYGAFAVLGALTAVIVPRWRAAWVGWWLAVALLAALGTTDFTDVGHLVALVIGSLLAVRLPVAAHWTPARCALLAVGAGFGYLMLAYSLPVMITPLVGLLGAGTAQLLVQVFGRRRKEPGELPVSGGG